MGGIYKYAVEMGSVAKIYISKFHNDWFSHSTVDILA
jgi:hypothetical protein